MTSDDLKKNNFRKILTFLKDDFINNMESVSTFIKNNKLEDTNWYFREFCSINWQYDRINIDMFNDFLDAQVWQIEEALRSIVNTNVDLFKCWFARFGNKLEAYRANSSIHYEANIDILNYIRKEGLQLINYKGSFQDAVAKSNIDMFNYFKDKVRYDCLQTLSIRSVDILTIIFQEHLPVKIDGHWSLFYMKYNSIAKEMLLAKGLLGVVR